MPTKSVRKGGIKKRSWKRKGHKKSGDTTWRMRGPAKQGQTLVVNAYPQTIQRFVKTNLNQFTGNGASTSLEDVVAFNLATMPDSSNITALYNEYRIRKITITATLLADRVGGGGTGGTDWFTTREMPTLYMRYNYDANLTSGGVPANVFTQPNWFRTQFTPEHTVAQYSFVPKTLTMIYLSGIATGYAPNDPLWVDTTYNTVPHYGLQFSTDFLATGFTLSFDVTYDVEFRYKE